MMGIVICLQQELIHGRLLPVLLQEEKPVIERSQGKNKAVVLGDFESEKFKKATKMLKENGYEVSTVPVEMSDFEAKCYPNYPDHGGARLINDLKTLKSFLNGEEIPLTMWNIV